MTPARSRSSWHFFVLVFLWALPLALIGLRYWTIPDASGIGTHEQLGFAACGFREAFGIPCPGCGVTTAVSHFAHGRPGLALATQPLGAVLGVLALALPILGTYRALSGADLSEDVLRLSRTRLLVAAAALVVVSWVYKLAMT